MNKLYIDVKKFDVILPEGPVDHQVLCIGFLNNDENLHLMGI